MKERVLLDEEALSRTITRLSHQILEKGDDSLNIVLVGIKTRGIYLAKRIKEKIKEIDGVNVALETLDITFYRDDLKKDGLEPQIHNINFKLDLTDKIVIIVDDVLYTGRTVRAAIDAIMKHYRPKAIRLAILVDRGHRELPIRADYVGKNIPTSSKENIRVNFIEVDKKDQVLII